MSESWRRMDRDAAMAETVPADEAVAEALEFESDGEIPNNRDLPAVVFRGAIPRTDDDPTDRVKALFEANGWFRVWDWTVYDYHHYHPGAHEALACVEGSARLMLGGAKGAEVEVAVGDVAVLPAGTGHCLIEGRDGFRVVGGYPESQEGREIVRAGRENHDRDLPRIAATPLPATDPLWGADGPLLSLWRG